MPAAAAQVPPPPEPPPKTPGSSLNASEVADLRQWVDELPEHEAWVSTFGGSVADESAAGEPRQGTRAAAGAGENSGESDVDLSDDDEAAGGGGGVEAVSAGSATEEIGHGWAKVTEADGTVFYWCEARELSSWVLPAECSHAEEGGRQPLTVAAGAEKVNDERGEEKVFAPLTSHLTPLTSDL